MTDFQRKGWLDLKAGVLYVVVFTLLLLFIPMIALNFEITAGAGENLPVHAPAVPEQSEADQPRGDLPSEDTGEAETGEVDEPETVSESVESGEERQFAVVAGEGDEPDLPVSDRGRASFRILDQTTGAVREVALRDFVRGAVAAEMPVTFHSEALKAQAVAAHTYALHNHYLQQENPDPELKGADFAADPGNLKVYMTEEDALAFYGEENGERYWKKICEAADSVLEYVLEYEDEPIVAAYHAISGGQTEDAANVWEGGVPYLLPADSEGDLLAPDYETEETISAEELRALFGEHYPEISLGDDPAQWFGGEERSGSGYITLIQVGDGALHGKEIRQMLDLRSHNFDVYYGDGVFTFRVFGYGHGVGLSQYGADFLARQGYGFDEILANYYTGATLKRVEVVEAVLVE